MTISGKRYWTIGVSLALAFCTSAALSQEAEKPSFVADGAFSVCVDPTFPPMEFMENENAKEPVGVDIDVAKALAEIWGAKASFITMDFNGLLPSLAAGRCDAVISGTLLREERLKDFDGIGYLNTFSVIVGKAGAAPISSLDEIAGKTIAVQSGTTYIDILQKNNEALAAKKLELTKIQQYPKQTDAIQQLLVGRVDGVLSQDTEISYREVQNPGQFATIYTIPQTVFEPYTAYIRKDEKDKAAFVTAIKSLLDSGKLRAIVDTWKLSPQQLDNIGS